MDCRCTNFVCVKSRTKRDEIYDVFRNKMEKIIINIYGEYKSTKGRRVFTPFSAIISLQAGTIPHIELFYLLQRTNV